MQTQSITSATVTQRIIRHRAEDLRRLADRAEREGVRIMLTADGEHFATSRRNPTALHRLSVDGCDCRGFLVWSRCGHHALLLAELGVIPDGAPEPEPTVFICNDITDRADKGRVPTFMAPSTTDRCPSCDGRGFTWAHEPGVQPFTRTCRPCHGVGQVKVGVVVGERELRVVA